MSAPDWWKDFFKGMAVECWLRVTTEEQTKTEVDFIEKALKLPRGAKVLDVPCGGGRHALELAARGYQVTGVDISSDFLKAARAQAAERHLGVTWEQQNMAELDWREEFDGAYCFGNSFGYQDDAGNARFAQAVARALKPNARFVLETGIVAESFLHTFQERRWWQMGDILFFSQGRYDPIQARAEIEYNFMRDGKIESTATSIRIYMYRELCRLFEDAGFRDCEGFGTLTQEPFRLGSPELLLTATRS